jgi:hypothetical protein
MVPAMLPRGRGREELEEPAAMAKATVPRARGPAELAEAPGVKDGRAKPDPGAWARPAAEDPGSAPAVPTFPAPGPPQAEGSSKAT